MDGGKQQKTEKINPTPVSKHNTGHSKTIRSVGKNDRAIRDPTRKSSRKGGFGKGGWGRPGDEYNMDTDLDPNDPNYDPSEEDMQVMPTSEPKKKETPPLTRAEYKQKIQSIVHEFFNHNDTAETIDSFEELNASLGWIIDVPVIALTVGLDAKDSNRELISLLLSDLLNDPLTSEQIQEAFLILLENISDLKLDSPNAKDTLTKFLARGIADDLLPPSFLSMVEEDAQSDEIKEIVKNASSLTSMKHGLSRLSNIWGIGGGYRPVTMLVNEMEFLLKEYIDSKDHVEAERILRELDVPHFHHEVIFRALLITLEQGSSLDDMVKILEFFSPLNIGLITNSQLKAGFKRIFDSAPDLVLDYPSCYDSIKKFTEACYSKKIIGDSIKSEIPQKEKK